MVGKPDRETQLALRHDLMKAAADASLPLPDAIRRMRKALGLTQAEFGKVFSLTPRQVSELENGKGDPKLSTLSRLGAAFGFRVGYLPKQPPHPSISK